MAPGKDKQDRAKCGLCGTPISSDSIIECYNDACPVPSDLRTFVRENQRNVAVVPAVAPTSVGVECLVLNGAPIVVAPYADLAIVLDQTLKAWIDRRQHDIVTENRSSCQCGALVCMEGVIQDSLQMIAAQILTELSNDAAQAHFVRHVVAEWPRCVAQVRGAIADPAPDAKAN